ncbi:MAG: hypothetical protein ABJK10_13775 [Rhodopirellula bahusiensis]|uniref:hypothetical protein n=1 Tax=Rhodopirellula bahusiensis TaxID=2014065 RepID=UPI003265FAE2
MAPSRCFGTKRGGQQQRLQAPNLPAIHHARRGLAYVWHDSDLGIEKIQLTILNCKIAGTDSAPM